MGRLLFILVFIIGLNFRKSGAVRVIGPDLTILIRHGEKGYCEI